MPYASTSDLPDGVKNALPEHGQRIYASAFNAAYKGTCKGSDECSAKVAWAAVKNKYEKGRDGKWTAKAEYAPEFSMTITKAHFDRGEGVMRWRAVASDTEEDLYEESMSLELFRSFIQRIEQNMDVPEPFASVLGEDGFWSGGMPYLSVSHYRSHGGDNVPGDVESVYIDGTKLKSTGTFKPTPLGLAAFRAVSQDLYGESNNENPVRISIKFLDLKHSHGDFLFERKSLTDHCPMCANGIGNKVYLDGQLIHEAMTRVPVNPRTEMEVDRMAKKQFTRKDDAESIVGELAEGLVEESQAAAALEDATVERSEEDETMKKTESKVVEKQTVEPDAVVPDPAPVVPESPAPVEPESPADPAPEASPDVPAEVVDETPVSKSIAALVAKARTLKESKTYGQPALDVLQASINDVGAAIVQEFSQAPSPDAVGGDIVAQIRSILQNELRPALQDALAPLTQRLALVESAVAVKRSIKTEIPAPRSVVLPVAPIAPQKSGATKGRSIREIAEASTR